MRMRPSSCLAVAMIAVAMSGCARKSPAQPDPASVSTVQAPAGGAPGVMTEPQLRSELMSFADRFATLSIEGISALEEQAVADPQARRAGLLHRVYTLTAAYELAISPNISGALLDMLALVTLTREVWEDHWRDKFFGDAAQPTVDALRELEADVWTIGARVLTDQQIAELRGAIDAWRRDNPDRFLVSHLRLDDLARDATFLAAAEQPGGFLGLNRAYTTLEETQQLLERTLWYLTRLQIIARWQIDLTYFDTMNSPQMKGVLDSINRIAATIPGLPADVADRSLTVSRELLRDITVEREAAINQILAGFAEERRMTLEAIASEEGPRAALHDARLTIEATDALLTRLDGLLTRLEPMMAETDGSAPGGRPFDITEYRDTAAEATRAAERLSDLVGSVDRILASPSMKEGLPVLVAEGQGLVNSLFRAGVLLVGILLGGLLAVLVTYRWVSVRLLSTAR